MFEMFCLAIAVLRPQESTDRCNRERKSARIRLFFGNVCVFYFIMLDKKSGKVKSYKAKYLGWHELKNLSGILRNLQNGVLFYLHI